MTDVQSQLSRRCYICVGRALDTRDGAYNYICKDHYLEVVWVGRPKESTPQDPEWRFQQLQEHLIG